MTDRIRFVAIALTLALESGGLASSIQRAANDAKVSAAIASKRMPDGNQWTTDNLNVDTDGSFCYENVEVNCRQYGRLYAWESAQRACQSLGDGWRLPTNDEWRQLAKHFGGVRDDPDDGGRAAYAAFIRGGRAGFMSCSAAVAAPTTASMPGWKPTDFTGRHRKTVHPPHGSTTLAAAAKSLIAIAMGRSREHFQCGA